MKPYKTYLQETKLSRVYKHFSSEEYPVGIITAFRDEKTLKQNLANNEDLARELKANGYGYVYVDGGWKEKQADGKLVDVEEDSILVIGNSKDDKKLFKLLLKNAIQYNQDGFLFKPEGELGIYLVDKDGNKDKISNEFKLDKFEYGYTKLRGGGAGKVFSFHEEREALSGYKRRLLREHNELIESFDLNNIADDVKKVTPLYAKGVLIDIYKQKYGDQVTDYIKGLDVRRAYTFSDSDEFLLYFVVVDEYLEVHFVNVTHKDDGEDTNTLDKISLKVFATVIKLLLEYTKDSGYKQVRVLSKESRLDLYKKILAKVLKQHNSDYKLADKQSPPRMNIEGKMVHSIDLKKYKNESQKAMLEYRFGIKVGDYINND